jgi:hypothetical protein
MAVSPGTTFEFETRNSIGNVLNTSTALKRPTSIYQGLLQRAFWGVFEPMAVIFSMAATSISMFGFCFVFVFVFVVMLFCLFFLFCLS